jgi:hypothetical protein
MRHLLLTVTNRIRLQLLEGNNATIALCRAVACRTGWHLVPESDSESPVLLVGPTPQPPKIPEIGFRAHPGPSATSPTHNRYPFDILAPQTATQNPNTDAPLTQMPAPLLHAHRANPRLVQPCRHPHGGLLLPNWLQHSTLNINGKNRFWAKSRVQKLIAITHLMAANDVGVLKLQET